MLRRDLVVIIGKWKLQTWQKENSKLVMKFDRYGK